MSPSKAVYVSGRVVVGVTHGDAFSKLPPEAKAGNEFVIGDWCAATGKFTDGDRVFFTKKTLLVRHGKPLDVLWGNPGLSEEGKAQVETLGTYLASEGIWGGCRVFCSPRRRCIETAKVLAVALGIRASTEVRLRERSGNEGTSEYRGRIIEMLGDIPQESILVSHCTFISDVAQLIGGTSCSENDFPTASMTLIDHDRLEYLGKGIPKDEEIRRDRPEDQV